MTRSLLAALAVVQLTVALVHVLWLGDLQTGADAAGVPAPYRELLLLAIAAVSVLLTGLAVLSAWFASGSRWREPAASTFALVGGFIWAARAVLELRYPVQLPVLRVGGASPAILAGSALASATYLLAWGSSRRSVEGSPT